jgi:hypothetical protein
MKFGKVAILSTATAVFFLNGHLGIVLGYQDMVCGRCETGWPEGQKRLDNPMDIV